MIQVLLILVLLASAAILIALYFFDTFSEMQTEDRIGMSIATWTFLSISLLFLTAKLETEIDEVGIHVRFKPLFWKFKTFQWSEIDKAYCRKVNPLFEFGGWGYRIGLGGRGHAYLISGKDGLQIELKNGKKRLIGTKHPEGVNEVLAHFLRSRSKNI